MKVVIVEEEEILYKALKEKFESENFGAVVATDGEAAVPVIREEKPDLILLDILLPKKNGFDVLAELKSDPELKNIPVIILSNLGQDEEVKKAVALGAADYCVKTQHSLNRIVQRVREYLQGPK